MSKTRRFLAAGAATVLMASGAAALASPAAAAGEQRQRFIITLADGVDSRGVAAEQRRKGADVDFVYTAALNGFAGEMSQANIDELRRDRRVVRIERDGVAHANTTQAGATWGLDRIDQRLGTDGNYAYNADGTGVHAYIVDTGINLSHSDFGDRAVSGYDAIDGGSADDCDGHGTHVAGTVGGSTWGVAKSVQLVAVRVLDCNGSGTWSGVIAGLDWVTTNAVKPAVANMSLGGGANSSVDDAVNRTINSGVSVVVAAGNGDFLGRAQDACKYSPARVPNAVTIGATTSSDAKTSWSNYGNCVDLFAPGSSITSAWHTSTTATNTISGTSMAAPHVAGVAALYLTQNRTAAPPQVRDAIYEASTKGIVTSAKTANNHLLYSLVTTSTGGDADNPPAVTISSPTSGTTVSGTQTVTASASDDKGVTQVEFFVDDVSIGTDNDPSGDWSIQWDTTKSSNAEHTLTAVATDGGSQSTTSAGVPVTVSNPTSSGILLTETHGKNKGAKWVTLTWTGASGSVDIYRSDMTEPVATQVNDTWTDNSLGKGGGSYTYKVCEAGMTTCSNQVTVTF